MNYYLEVWVGIEMNVLEAQSHRRGKDHHQNEPLEVWTVNDSQGTHPNLIPLFIQLGVSTRLAAKASEREI